MTTRRRGMTEEAADTVIDQACRMLRLPTIRASFPDMADQASNQQMSYRGFLAELLLAECDDRARRRSERRIKAAGFPREKSLRTFDFAANPNIDPATITTLSKSEWVKKGQPLCLIGDSGTGKSHLLIALGTEAAMAGYRVKYTLATKLANELVEAADEMMLTKTIARYGRVDLLCIDELGYMQLDRRGAELLSRSSPNAKRRTPSRSPPTSPSQAGPKPSPTRACAQRSWTASPTEAPSSKPAPTPTVSPTDNAHKNPEPHDRRTEAGSRRLRVDLWRVAGHRPCGLSHSHRVRTRALPTPWGRAALVEPPSARELSPAPLSGHTGAWSASPAQRPGLVGAALSSIPSTSRGEPNSMLDFTDVTFGYGRTRAFYRGLIVSFPPGRTVLLGPNGAGKTTLMNLAAGWRKPKVGQVRLGNRPSHLGASQRKLGYMPQSIVPMVGLTALEQVTYAAWLKGLSRQSARRAAGEAIALVGLSEKKDQGARTLSGGQLRRLGLAAALAHHPDVLLLDEPTAGLDPSQKGRYRSILLSSEMTRNWIVSTHDVQDVEDLYDNVVVVAAGQIRWQGSPADFSALAPPGPRQVEDAFYSVVGDEI